MNQMCYREIKHRLNDRAAYGGRYLKDHSFPAPAMGWLPLSRPRCSWPHPGQDCSQ